MPKQSVKMRLPGMLNGRQTRRGPESDLCIYYSIKFDTPFEPYLRAWEMGILDKTQKIFEVSDGGGLLSILRARKHRTVQNEVIAHIFLM